MISHYNVIANVMQVTAYESVGRRQFDVCTEVQLGVLPLSHIYGLVFIAHTAIYRGDEVIVMPKFDLRSLVEATQRFKIEKLMLVSRSALTPAISNHLTTTGASHHSPTHTKQGRDSQIRSE